MSIFFTIIAGVVTFVLGQVVVRIYLEPVQHFRSLIGETSVSLINYGIFGRQGEEYSGALFQDASKEIRLLASRLEAGTYLIPNYEAVAKLFKLPSKPEVYEAVACLLDISNTLANYNHLSTNYVFKHYNNSQAEKVRGLLKVYVPDPNNVVRDEKA